MCQPTLLAPKGTAISSSTYRFEFISCLGVVQSLLNRNDGHRKLFSGQMANGKCQMFDSEIEPAQLLTASMVCSRFFQASISPTVSSFSPTGRFKLGMGPKTIPFKTSFVPSSFKMAIIPSFCKRLCAARIHLFFQSKLRVLGVSCCQMPADVNASNAWTHQKKYKKHPTKKSAPKIIGK